MTTNSWFFIQIIIIEDFESEKKKLLFTLTVCQADIDKIYLCDKDPYEAK